MKIVGNEYIYLLKKKKKKQLNISILDITKRWQKQSNDFINHNDALPASI